jgi:hypothetical protein
MANTAYSQEYPLGTPSVSGSTYTVDLMLKEPTRINAYVSNVALYGYFAERIFNNAGGVSGGALLYTQLTTNDLFPTRRAQNVAPGAEFPEVTFDRPTPKTAQVEKLGGKFRVTDEARDRNDLTAIQSEGTKLGNDIRDQLHTRALAELDASIAAIGSDVQVTGTSWADAAALTLTTTANNLLPATDFAQLSMRAANQRLGTHVQPVDREPAGGDELRHHLRRQRRCGAGEVQHLHGRDAAGHRRHRLRSAGRPGWAGPLRAAPADHHNS